MKRIDGPAKARLREILLRLLSLEQFDMLLEDYLNLDRETIALGGNKEEIFFRVIAEAYKRVWLAELVEAARQVRPRDSDLYAFTQEYFGLGVVGAPAPDTLERIVIPASKFINPADWRTKLAAIERQVCRIRFPVDGGFANGTGFLVAPSVVLTNYHVVKPIIDKKATADSVRVQFDYKIVGNKTLEGKVVNLASEWLLESSPYALADVTTGMTVPPTEKELDYAFLRLDEAVADEPVGPTTDPHAELRGYLDLDEAAKEDPKTRTAVVIVQHPKGGPLAMTMEMQGLLGPNTNNTRLKYSNNTEGGSSGSPVFDLDWQLIALHHAGDPDYTEFHKPDYNQGVPIRLILEASEAVRKTF